MSAISLILISGPCFFLMSGTGLKKGFTPECLVKHGACPGSRVVMTPSGFLTDDAFDQFVEDLAKGIRALPVICAHPTWWVLMTMDGFHAHKMTLRGMSILAQHLILVLIEEGDNSQVAQPFDKFVARYGKGVMREALEVIMTHRVFKSQVLMQCFALNAEAGRDALGGPEQWGLNRGT